AQVSPAPQKPSPAAPKAVSTPAPKDIIETKTPKKPS
ncbi:DNA mismatch repair protein MutS, partial [bacterium (Candidatus Torokbacteria) CG_4_10_14_0_2_um_filter_35_8]